MKAPAADVQRELIDPGTAPMVARGRRPGHFDMAARVLSEERIPAPASAAAIGTKVITGVQRFRTVRAELLNLPASPVDRPALAAEHDAMLLPCRVFHP